MSPTDDDDMAWTDAAIEDAHVATVPGSAFNASGYARISYAVNVETLKEALSIMGDAHDAVA
jgi:aspartate aminotransferase